MKIKVLWDLTLCGMVVTAVAEGVCSFHLLGIVMIYLLIAVRLTPGGSSTVHIYTKCTERQKTNNI